ncbi:MAG: hypothetical protein WA691_04730 [Thermoplasmata archaeon]
MTPTGPTEVYEIRRTFNVPADFAYRWCTDFTPEDGKLSQGENSRQILRRSSRRVVYEDLYPSPNGWMWSRQTVTLHPPNRWTAVAEGNYRHWDLVYTLRSLGEERTEFTLHGVRRPQFMSQQNPSQRTLNAELHAMWRNYGIAMEKEYRASRRRAKG